jgi:D-alanyl-lipoteichoic acid acyltransferase DltB (MBOAT superfamily)
MGLLSGSFALFVALVFLTCQLLPRARASVLLLASLVFYASLGAPRLLAALAISSLIGFGGALALVRTSAPARRHRWLWAGIVANLLVLFLVKEQPMWLGLLAAYWPAAWGPPPVPPAFVVATGVSFFVFQSISYLVDVYLGTTPATRRLGHFLLYMAFFPRVLQGPVERAGDFLAQLVRPATFSYEQARAGLLLVLWGAVKKGVVGDSLVPFVNAVFAAPEAASGLDLLLGLYTFALQLYFDFSGYSDMAVGLGRLFGIELTQNFRNPFGARSIAEFWRRWHISFSRWILDYLFRPLSLQWRRWGNRGVALALFLSFLLSGLWHGLRTSFLVWGGIHGLAMGLSVLTGPWRKRCKRRWSILGGRGAGLLGWLLTLHVTCLAWLFFRASSLDVAWAYWGGLWHRHAQGVPLLLANRPSYVALATLLIGLVVDGLARPHAARFFAWPRPLRWGCYYALLLVYYWGATAAQTGFIYFQF